MDSISGVTDQYPALRKEWVGLILLPIAGNAAGTSLRLLAYASYS